MITTLARKAVGQRGLGYVKAKLPPSTTGRLIGTGGVPDAATLRDARVQPKDQSASNSCLGQSVAQAYRLTSLHQGIDCPDLSALFSYRLGCASLGLTGDDGMTFGAALSAVTRFGIASEASWPMSLLRVTKNPSPTAYHDAYDRRGLRGYQRIDVTDLDSVRRAIARGIAVIGAFPVDSYFGLNSGPELIERPTVVKGYHALVIESYLGDGTFGILNHYGTDWRNGGRCSFTEDYMRASDAFVAFDITLAR